MGSSKLILSRSMKIPTETAGIASDTAGCNTGAGGGDGGGAEEEVDGWLSVVAKRLRKNDVHDDADLRLRWWR